MKKLIRVYDINWYYNYEDHTEMSKEVYDATFNAEPTEMIIDISDLRLNESDVDGIEDDISDYITGESGYFHEGFSWEWIKQSNSVKLELTKDEALELCGLAQANLEQLGTMEEYPDIDTPGILQHAIANLESLLEKVDHLVEQLNSDDMALAPEEEVTTNFFVENPETSEKIHIVFSNADLINTIKEEIMASIDREMEYSSIAKSCQQ